MLVEGIVKLRTRWVAVEDLVVGLGAPGGAVSLLLIIGGVGAPPVLATALLSTRPPIVRSMNVNRTIQVYGLSQCPHVYTDGPGVWQPTLS